LRLAFLTPAPDLAEPWRWAFDPEAKALEECGFQVDPIPWTEAGDLSDYDLVVPLLAWGYFNRYAEWLALLDRFEREHLPVVNPPALLRWNSDKAYLAELAGKGVSTVPTLAVDNCDEESLRQARQCFGTEELVIKPPISAGAAGTHRLGPHNRLPHENRGRRAIIQPMLQSILSQGEYSLILFDGALSHAVVKRPKAGDFRVQPHLGGSTHRCDPPPGAEALARAALGTAPAHATYARVDMVAGDDGELMIIELELVEPAFFLSEAPEGALRFGTAIRSAALRSADQSLPEQPLADR
jgi:glutathione synthase/RimK-type ligase-like ATP-grasp enzyme